MLLSDIKTQLSVINHGERVILSNETIDKTCQWYADNSQGCIDEVLSGKVSVNDQDEYIKTKLADKHNYLTKNFDLSLAFYQKALYIQTGQNTAILS